jgi:hypothetical protein
MLTIRSPGGAPSLEEVKKRYALSSDEIDERFGVVLTDPNDHLYTILVARGAAPKVRPDQDWQVEGPFSNPRIEPFGPPER